MSNLSYPDRPPLIVDPNYPAIEFITPGSASEFRSRNTLRPQTQVTFTGPQAVNYFVGLAIVPIVLIVFLLLWLLLLSILGCCQARLEERTRQYQRKPIWACMTFVLVGSLIAWVVALANSISSLNDLTLSQSLAHIGDMMSSITVKLEESGGNIIKIRTAMNASRINCDSPNPVVERALGNLSALVNSTSDSLDRARSAVIPYTSRTASDLYVTSDALWSFFYIRTVVFSAISGIQVALVLLCFVVAAMGWAGKIREIRWFNRGCCCRGCCTPLLFFAVFTTVLMIALSALLHAIALALSDLCSPNVNTAINRIAGQLMDYPTFASFYGANLTEMCDAANDTSPLPILVLCFYQTCRPQTAFVTKGVQALDGLFNVGREAINKSAPLIAEIQALIPSTSCADSLRGLLPNYIAVVVHAFDAISLLSCNSINQLYAQAVYDTLCSGGVSRAVVTFDAWISGSLLLMAALAVWLVFRKALHEDHLKSDEYATQKIEPPVQQPLMDDTRVPRAFRPPEDHEDKATDGVVPVNSSMITLA